MGWFCFTAHFNPAALKGNPFTVLMTSPGAMPDAPAGLSSGTSVMVGVIRFAEEQAQVRDRFHLDAKSQTRQLVFDAEIGSRGNLAADKFAQAGLACVEEGDDVVRRVAGFDVDVALIKRRKSAIQRIVVQAQLGVDVEGDNHPFVVVVDGVVATARIAAMVDEGSQRRIDRGHARERRNS